jgi:hypothetical protein
VGLVRRSTPLKRTRRRLKRSRPKRGGVSEETYAIAWARTGGRCACGCDRRGDQVHHVFPKAANKWPELIDEPDNCVLVAGSPCHSNHETAFRRLPRSACAPAEHLAVTESMRAYLDRVYASPRVMAEAALAR